MGFLWGVQVEKPLLFVVWLDFWFSNISSDAWHEGVPKWTTWSFFGREPMGGSMVRKNLTQRIPQGRPLRSLSMRWNHLVYKWPKIKSWLGLGVINLYSQSYSTPFITMVTGLTLQKSNCFGCELARINGDSDFFGGLFILPQFWDVGELEVKNHMITLPRTNSKSSETRMVCPKKEAASSLNYHFSRANCWFQSSVPHLFPSPLSKVDAKKGKLTSHEDQPNGRERLGAGLFRFRL